MDVNLRCGAQHVKVIDPGENAYRFFRPMAFNTGSSPIFDASKRKLLLLSLPKARVSASVSIQCTPVGCVHSLMANACQVGKVVGWPSSVSLKTSAHVAVLVAVQRL
jgi:hypothetical protein